MPSPALSCSNTRTIRRVVFAFLVVASLALVPPGRMNRTGEIQLRWDVVAPGVWRATAGAPEPVSLLGAAGGQPCRDALASMPPSDFPFPWAGVRAERRDGKTVLRFPLGADEQLYGLGLSFKAVQQRGTVKTLRVDHYGGSDNGRTHAPVPFYVSSAGYGVLVDAARYMTVYAGTAVRADSDHPPDVRDRNTDPAWSAQPASDTVDVLVPAEGAVVYVFAGPTMLDAVRRYNLYSGGGALPPKWGLGFMHRVRSLATADEALAEVGEFAARNVPLDVLGLEPGWQSKSYPCTYVWDRGRFPDPAGFLRRLREMNVGVNLWFNPYVSPDSPIHRDVKEHAGSHTVWTGLVPDYSQPATRAIVRRLFEREHLAIGVGGYKIDEVDGYDRWLWPDHAVFPSGLSGEQMRQVFGLHVQRTVDSMFRDRGVRTYGLVRGTNAGAAPLPFVIYNDAYSHEEFITALVSSSFAGVLWTPEVRSSRTGEEWLRRMQSVCFSPLAMLNAWADATKPWSFPEVESAVRDVMQLRTRLLPYFYTAFARYHFDGTPPFRAMALVDGFLPPGRPASDKAADDAYAVARRRDIKDQYMAGDSLLVAPMFAGQISRRVVLPAGRWYDFYTGAYVGSAEVVSVTPGLDKIPLFVRDGGLIPMIAARRQVPGPGERADLEVRHYGEAEGQLRLYDDDGRTFKYEAGEYSWTVLRMARDSTGALRGEVAPPDTTKPFAYGHISWTKVPVAK
jgi:alpha-glucosidase (family GH31 glycosyl hydrolase)